MAVWILVAFWVVVGLGVFLVALRGGGRRHGSGGAGGDTRASRRGTALLAIAAFLIFGVALPAIVVATNGEDKRKQGPGGVDLNRAQIHGRTLFVESCSTCHTLGAVNAVGRVGPNLDELRPPKELVVNAIDVGRAQGRGQMPADLYAGQDANDVASFVAAVAGR